MLSVTGSRLIHGESARAEMRPAFALRPVAEPIHTEGRVLMNFRILRAELQNERDCIGRAATAVVVEPLNYWAQSRFLDAMLPNAVRLGDRTWKIESQDGGQRR